MKKYVMTAVAGLAMVAFGMGTAAQAGGAKIFVIGGKPDDPFWGIVKRGAEDAAKVVEAQGGSVTWLGPQNYDNLGVDAAELIRQAIAQGATGVVGPDWVPDAMDPAFKAVVDKKIPLVIYNAGGIQAADRLGALNYVGAIDYKAGVAGGEYVAKAGAKNGVCINSLPGAKNIEDYCNGFKEGLTKNGAKYDMIPLPATAEGNVAAVAEAFKAYLTKNPNTDAVFTTANLDAIGAAQGIAAAKMEGKVKLCGINFDEGILNQIKTGKQVCAIDQQGYQQGFYAVSILNGYINYGLTIATREILTGPGVVDAKTIDATMAGAKQGTR